MSNLLVHNMDAAWTSSNPGLLQVSSDNQTFVGEGPASNLLIAQAGAINLFAEFLPALPLDLSAFDELRFWLRANRAAEGTISQPFYLEFSYTDTNDIPGEAHRWLIPVNRAEVWEQRRIGIENDRRSSITRFRFTCLTNLPFACHIDELLAVREEMLLDLEQALSARLDGVLNLPGLSNIALKQAAAPGDTQIVLPLNRGFDIGNRLLIRGGAAGDEIHNVIGVAHERWVERPLACIVVAPGEELTKEEVLEFPGIVTELLPNAMFRVKLENEHEIIAQHGQHVILHVLRSKRAVEEFLDRLAADNGADRR